MLFILNGELAGDRTQDPRLKRALLYQLSYELVQGRFFKATIGPSSENLWMGRKAPTGVAVLPAASGGAFCAQRCAGRGGEFCARRIGGVTTKLPLFKHRRPCRHALLYPVLYYPISVAQTASLRLPAKGRQTPEIERLALLVVARKC